MAWWRARAIEERQRLGAGELLRRMSRGIAGEHRLERVAAVRQQDPGGEPRGAGDLAGAGVERQFAQDPDSRVVAERRRRSICRRT
ncbi:hypothetical protein QFW77_11815 [Luteimonas sp. RD2P54]|uniref:Uncharacterized protein n=1 Tax=Luteimonas endophytica TaxID=3042023 RepID=A0ABT6JBW5_9GAMM|nr:hypothetical protein [Luteimonas endophytica]MDH5823673.1 hypothetical protein [Luteimonas endophytica]